MWKDATANAMARWCMIETCLETGNVGMSLDRRVVTIVFAHQADTASTGLQNDFEALNAKNGPGHCGDR